MKKLLLSLVVLASLVSCGKDNKVSSNSTSSSNGFSNSALVGTSLAAAQDLTARINSPGTFGEGLVLTSSGSSNQTCGTKWGFINYCYGSSSGGNYAVSAGMTWNQLAAQRPSLTYYYAMGGRTVHGSVAVATKQSELIQLINSASNIQVSGSLYYIQVPNGIYVVDTRYPIQANPSALKSAQGEDYLVGAY